MTKLQIIELVLSEMSKQGPRDNASYLDYNFNGETYLFGITAKHIGVSTWHKSGFAQSELNENIEGIKAFLNANIL